MATCTPAASQLKEFDVIITGIEISYFRSFYKAEINKLGEINVIFGENDSGKSNIARALNLFFNQEISPGQFFDFDIEFNNKRSLETAGSGKRFIYIKVFFKTPDQHRDSLGDTFYVKRQWNSLSDSDEFSEDYPKEVKQTKYRKQVVTKILNKIRYIYVPAIKDSSVLDFILLQYYESVRETEGFLTAKAGFQQYLDEQMADFTAAIRRVSGIDSKIADEILWDAMFSSFDFKTEAQAAGEGRRPVSLRRQRGDGIQVQHLIELIGHIASLNRNQYHIWALEEPENSLSISAQSQLATRMKELSREEHNQILITTHSPSFYSLSGTGVSKFFVNREDGLSNVIEGAKFSDNDISLRMGHKFLIPHIAPEIERIEKEREELSHIIKEFELQSEENNRPRLILEGPADVALFEAAWNNLYNNEERAFEIVSIGGCGNLKPFKSISKSIAKNLWSGKIAVLVDGDKAGRAAIPFPNISYDGFKSHENGIYWGSLRPTQEQRNFLSEHGIEEASLPVTLEDLIPTARRRQAEEERIYRRGDMKADIKLSTDILGIIPIHDSDLPFVYDFPDEAKIRFSEWCVGNLERQEFEEFRQYFSRALQLFE
ncbi:MAG: AAA family ATPase [Pseudomonadota bacterium]|nr:AAA family ATPase [Pseudomonadota bacterium]